MRATTAAAFAEIENRRSEWSSWCRTVWEYGETAWREYRSAAFLADVLEREGFDVERGSAGMPTAFVARWGRGAPTVATIAEYDGVPDNCQAADVVKRPRDGLGPRAGGHTDPHSALGTAAIMGMIGAKRAMLANGLPGTLVVFGEPAEKVRGSKPIHAARGAYDSLDAAVSFHPFYMLPLCNTVRWDTHCGAGFAWVTRFLCEAPETWPGAGADSPIPASHSATRAPGANDALVQFLAQTKAMKEHILPSGLSWSINEAILTAGQATADNLPAPESELMVMARVPTVDLGHHVVRLYDRIADAVAATTHCRWERVWVSKSRPGLANHAMASATWRNLAAVGAPRFGPEAVALANRIEESLGIAPRPRPFLPAIEALVPPEAAEAALRAMLPAAQKSFTSDDYTEFTWSCPTSRFYVGRPALAPGGVPVPAWAMNALGGLAPCIDPMTEVAAKTIAGTVLDLVEDPAILAAARAEFVERTGGGIGGTRWLPPLCDYDPPIDLRWPEYVTTARGTDWVIPSRR